MEDNDEIYVMADPNSPQVTPVPPPPVPPQRKLAGKTLWLLGGLIAIATGILAYFLVNKTPVAEQKPAQITIAPQGTGNLNPSTNPPSPQVLAATQKQKLIINFGHNKAELMPADISKIQSLWSNAKGKNGTVIITGHTDNLGAELYNQNLSQKRAQKAAEILQSLGIDNSYQLKVQGFGETQPIANNSTAQGRALNRRVEVYLTVQN